jgi:hypothetical protein
MKTVLGLLFFVLGFHIMVAHPGIGIVMNTEGTVYYTDLSHVWKISPDGTHTVAVKDVHTHELYLDENDDLYGEHVWYEGEATDKWGSYVWCLSSSGILKQTVPPIEGFLSNNTLVRDAKSNMYWPDKYGNQEVLKKETPQGEISLHSDHKFKDIRWMYYSESDAHIYLIDHLNLKKVDSNGQVTLVSDNLYERNTIFENVRDQHYLMGMWTDTRQNIYVAAYGAQKVKKIHPNRSVETVFESGRFWSPCGGLAALDGSLWIMEFSVRNKTRVRKITADGSEVVFQK